MQCFRAIRRQTNCYATAGSRRSKCALRGSFSGTKIDGAQLVSLVGELHIIEICILIHALILNSNLHLIHALILKKSKNGIETILTIKIIQP